MHIKKLKLSNFKSIDKLDIKFGRVNVLVGANASGKSNIFYAFKFIRDIYHTGLENAIALQGGIEYILNFNFTDRNEINVDLELDYENDLKFFHKKNIGTVSKTIKYHLEILTDRNENFKIKNEKIDVKTFIIEGNPFQIKNGKNIGHYFFNTIFSRNESEDPKLFHLPNPKYVNNSININSELNEYDPFFNWLDNFKSIDKKIFDLSLFHLVGKLFPLDLLINFPIYSFDFNLIKSSPKGFNSNLKENGENIAYYLKNILNDLSKKAKFINYFKYFLPYFTDISIIRLSDNSLTFMINEQFNQNKPIPSEFLSDGTIVSTALITALFFDRNKISMFEEPDHTLHPGILSNLMSLIYEASSDKQIFLTTHNPEMVKHTKLDDLFLVKRNDKGFTEIHKPKDGKMLASFLNNDIGIDELFVQNLLDV